MSSDDADYLARRARQERERAQTATAPEIAEVHLIMARLYEQRLAELSSWDQHSTQK